MPITISYDLETSDGNDRTYIRSMLERFHWKRLGGSVFRYDGVDSEAGRVEDWLNHVVPALMFLRSYAIKHTVRIRYFTLDASSTSHVDHSDLSATFGEQPLSGDKIDLATPTNVQSSVATIQLFVNTAVDAT